MKNKIYILLLGVALLCGCSGFLDQNPDKILTDDQIFNDEVMLKSVLANYYSRVTWGQHHNDSYSYTIIDEAAKFDGGPDHRSTFEDDRWRVYDYTLLRNINQFLKGLRETKALDEEAKKVYFGEARFLRAWCYFNMVRSLGGVPIIDDEVYDYTPGMNVEEELQRPRSTEKETYDYIISECQEIADLLTEEKTINSARANKWTVKMLEARAALYAASIAKYNSLMVDPLKTTNGSVGISSEFSKAYYTTALNAAKAVINGGVYELQDKKDDKGVNFYEATSVKENNTEVIWARDYIYPGQTTEFTKFNIPKSHAEDIDNSYGGPILNLVEEYELIETDNPGYKEKIKTKDEDGNYIFYSSADAPFKDRDPRLWGTVIYPGAEFKGTPVILQAGQLNKTTKGWSLKVGPLDSKDENGNIITSFNGPRESNEQYINKSGFYYRKFLDETPQSSTRGRNSEMWMPRFRISEAYMIACEASFELGQNAEALNYINKVRDRAGVKQLQSITFDNIVHERRVEFAFEDHRYWDLKRWRLAHKVWTGNNDDENARHRRLWPYMVVAPGDPNDGKWVFIEDFLFMSPNARYFKMQNYYNFIDLGWINNNPKLEKNPYQ